MSIFNNHQITPPILPPPLLDLRIVFISTYPPRRCGIATYTKDLTKAINNLNPYRLCEIVALDDQISEQLEYPWEVGRRVRQNEWQDYEKVLDYLNNSVIDIVSIQHEFGIFGGRDGEYILRFAQKLKKPYFVTFHTVLQKPDGIKKKIIYSLAKKASAVIVMLPAAADILRDVYKVAPEKISSIPHGTPDFPLCTDEKAKQEIGAADKIIMTSINLISPKKGLNYAIQALPEVVDKYPNFVYYIIGQTHPQVLEREGEGYRNSLKKLVKDLDLQGHVKFLNRYLTLETLTKYLKATDFYITPYEGLEQISSGALAYAVAAGALCVSTPYRYAREILAGSCGYLVKPKDPKSITEAILKGLQAPEEMRKIRNKSYYLGRTMVWERIAFRHIRVIDHLLRKAYHPNSFPEPKLAHLYRLTTEIGLVEHTAGNNNNYEEGYSVDDNSRGLIAAINFGEKDLAQTYLNYLSRSEENGKIYCDSDQNGLMVGEPGLGEWFGRTFWAVSFAMHYGPTDTIRHQATQLMVKMLPRCLEIKQVRALSFILLGLTLLKDLEWKEFEELRKLTLEHALKVIQDRYKKHSTPEWHWLEGLLRYDNCRIPFALLRVAEVFKLPQIEMLALEMLDFILDETYDSIRNHFRFIGNKGWYRKGKSRAWSDEQPIDAGSTVCACYEAYMATGLNHYKSMALKAFAWYHGDNIAKRPLVNIERSSVYDGVITKNGQLDLNLNQGAESIVEYLISYIYYCKLQQTNGIKKAKTDYI